MAVPAKIPADWTLSLPEGSGRADVLGICRSISRSWIWLSAEEPDASSRIPRRVAIIRVPEKAVSGG
ncbi:unnamed protein product [Sphagnum tenellum]